MAGEGERGGTPVATEARLLDIYKGGPYAGNLQAYLPMDHPGRGLTMPDRSVAGNCSGTISGTNTAAIWDFVGHPKLAALSLDGLNDFASTTEVNISGGLSAVYAMKVRSTYDDIPGGAFLLWASIDGGNLFRLAYSPNVIEWRVYVGAVQRVIDYSTKPSIDDYLIFIGTLTIGGETALYVNGSLVGTETGLGVMPGGAAGAGISTGSYEDVSSSLLAGLVDGALSVSEAKQVSRNINNMLGLGLSI